MWIGHMSDHRLLGADAATVSAVNCDSANVLSDMANLYIHIEFLFLSAQPPCL